MKQALVLSAGAAKAERLKLAKYPWSITLPKPPSVNACYGQAPGRQRYKTAQYKAWEAAASDALKDLMAPQYPGAVWVTLTFGKSKRRSDHHNYIKPVMDLLVGAGIIVDDSDDYIPELTSRADRAGRVHGVRIDLSPFHISNTSS